MRSILLTLLVVIASMAQGPTPPKSAPDPTYTQLRSLKISGETIAVEALTIRKDAATFTFNNGEFHFVEPVNGKVHAAVFIGQGTFNIQPPTDVEKRYLALFTKTPDIPFTEVVLHFVDGTYQEILRGAVTAKGTPNQRAAAILRDREDLLRKGRDFLEPNVAVNLLEYDLAARLFADINDPSHAGFFNAFIKGTRFPNLMFRIDPRGLPVVAPEEVLLADFDNDDLGIWSSFHLQSHYARGAAADEAAGPIHIEHQEIQATIDGTVLRAKVRTTVRVLSDGARVLPFDLHPSLRVSRVTDGGEELQFIQGSEDSGSDLAVVFPKPLTRGTRILEFEYSGDKAIAREGTGNYTLVGKDGTPFPVDRATYDMSFRIPKDLVMVATGEPQGSSEQGNQTVSRWTSDVPLAVAGFNFGLFKKSEVRDTKLGYVIESYANTDTTDLLKEFRNFVDVGTFNTTQLMDKARNEAQVSLGIYQNYFGKLPYGRLAMTQQPAYNFGQAWPMLIYMPITAFFDETIRHQIGMTNPRATDFFRYVAPHEVAHQWWGHLVGWKSYRDQWMSEGFAEFSASLFAQLTYGEEKFIDFWRNQRHLILDKNSKGKRPGEIAPVTLGYRADNARTGSDVTRRLIYPKGAFILHMVRMMMYDHRNASDDRFIAMMRDFVKTHYNQNVSTEDFKAIVEKHMTSEMDLAGNKKMDWFFDEYVYGTTIPKYALTYQLQTSGEQTTVKMHVTQSEVPSDFLMTVPIYFEGEGKKLGRIGALALKGNSSRDASVTLNFRPKRLVLSAFEDVLADIQN